MYCIYNKDVKGSLKLALQGVHADVDSPAYFILLWLDLASDLPALFMPLTPGQLEIGPGNLCLNLLYHCDDFL